MGRLTKKDGDGNWRIYGIPWAQISGAVYGALCKLKDYEDTGLSPVEIIDGKLLNGWIPVEERLPQSEMMVLVSCQTKKGIKSINRAYYLNEMWHGSGSMSGVVAWMPLPEPYKPD